MRVDGAMVSPDGQWRVEAVRDGAHRWYRLIHYDGVIDYLTIGRVAELLDAAGASLADLEEAA